MQLHTLKSIAADLTASSEGSRELDALIHEVLGALVSRSHRRMGYAIKDARFYAWCSGPHWSAMPRVTHELEAARDLFKAMTAGTWSLLLEDHGDRTAAAAMRQDEYGDLHAPELRVDLDHPRLAVGVCAVLFLALAHEDDVRAAAKAA